MIAPAVLPHHCTDGSVYGGSNRVANAALSCRYNEHVARYHRQFRYLLWQAGLAIQLAVGVYNESNGRH